MGTCTNAYEGSAFLPVKIKTARENAFLRFFLIFFTGRVFFTVTFKKNSRVAKSFHEHFSRLFHGLNLKFNGQKSAFFHRHRENFPAGTDIFSWVDFKPTPDNFFIS